MTLKITVTVSQDMTTSSVYRTATEETAMDFLTRHALRVSSVVPVLGDGSKLILSSYFIKWFLFDFRETKPKKLLRVITTYANNSTACNEPNQSLKQTPAGKRVRASRGWF